MANLASFPAPLMLLLLVLVTVLVQRASAQQKTKKQGIPIMLGLGPDPCGQKCDFVYNPVCGNDGTTYPNSCFLSQSACRSPGIVPLSYRPCATPDPCNFVCDRMLDPVCGTDGRTYTNPCVLMYYSCYYSGSGLVRRHFGRCAVDRVCPTSCPRTREPVCGSDGRTYANPCSLLLQVCGGRNVFKAKDGACSVCPRPCTRIYLPVCGSDGVTYPSQCVMESRVCEGLPVVTRAYEGPCST